MKITQNPAQRFRWAKRSLSIVLSTAMLLTALVVGLVPASAGLIIEEAVRGPDPIVFVVPETVYMTPKQSGSTAPQYFLNNNLDGTAITDPDFTGTNPDPAKNPNKAIFHIQVPDAASYALYFNGSASPNLSWTPTNPGDPWDFELTAAQCSFMDTANPAAQGSGTPKEWRLEATVFTEQKSYYNYTTFYQPVWVPSVHGVGWNRKNSSGCNPNRGPQYDSVSWIAGLHANWEGNKVHNADEGDEAMKTNDWTNGCSLLGPTGRIADPTATSNTYFKKIAPLLGIVERTTDGGYGYMGGLTHATTNPGYKAEGTNVYGGDRTGISSGRQDVTDDNLLIMTPPGRDTNNNNGWGRLHIDTSRHSHFGSIPNFSLGMMSAWIANGSDNIIKANSAAKYTISAYEGDITNTNNIPTSQFTNVAPDKYHAYSTSDSSYRTDTTPASLSGIDVPTDRDYIMFFTNEQMYGGANNQWMKRLMTLRIYTPHSDKSDMRKRIDAVIRKAGYGTQDYRDALRAAMANLGNPAVGPDMNLVKKLEQKVAAWPPSVTTQKYQFNDINATPNVTVTADGTEAPFIAPANSDTGAVYKTGDYSITADGRTPLWGAVTAVRDYFVGYKYTGMTVQYHDRGVWDTPVLYPSDTTVRRAMVTGAVRIVYIYDPIPYTIKFDGNGGTEVTPGSMGNTAISFNERQLLKPNDFEKPGYDFAGWSTEKNGTPIYDNGDPVINLTLNPKENGTTAVTLYACWTLKADINVVFDANGGTLTGISSKMVQFDAKYGDPEPAPSPPNTKPGLSTAERPGYVFDGWWDTVGGNVKQITAASIVKNETNPHSLYAKWVPETFDIALDVNGGNPLPAAQRKLLDAEFTGPYPTLPTPTRENYEFRGWSTVKNDTGVAADPFVALDKGVTAGDPIGGVLGDKLEILAAHTLYAQWTPDEYTVTFDALGGAVDAAWLAANPAGLTVKYGKPYPTLPTTEPSPMPAGATTFEYWYVDGGDGAELFDNTTLVTTIGDHTLKAKWDGILPGVTFVKYGGVIKPVNLDNKEVVLGEDYGVLPVPVRDGYTFAGWYFDDATFANVVTATTPVATGDPHKIYAKWDAIDYTVTFMPEGGDMDAGLLTRTVTYGTRYDTNAAMPDAADVERDGYDFAGWYLTTDYTGTAVADATVLGTFGTPAKDHNLYAKWDAISYTVKFNTNGGPAFTPPADEKSVAFGAAYGTLADAPARMGYIFDGWWTDAVDGTKVRATTPVTIFDDHSIFAQWIAIPITVTFKDPLGLNKFTPASKKVALATKYGTLPPNPVLDGYVFAGWLSSFDGALVTKNTLVPDNAIDHELIAQWAPADIEVTLDYKDGDPPTTVVGSAKYTETYITVPELNPANNPTRLGFTFVEWSLDGTAVTDASTVTLKKPHTIVAVWDGGTYEVEYDVGAAPVTPANEFFKNGTKYGDLLAKPEYPGYNLLGWCLQSDLSDAEPITKDTEVYLTSTPTPTTFYAKWEPKTLKVSFDTKGGNAIADLDVTFDAPYAGLTTPVRAGYTFIEWQLQTEGGAAIANGMTVTTVTNHKLVAKWTANTIKVNFFDDTDYVWDDASDKTRDVTFDGTYGVLDDGTKKAMPVPVRGGYALKGWYTEPDGAGQRVKATTKVTTPGEHTLYPLWTLADMKIALYRNYDAADETFKEVAFTFDSEYDDVLVDPERKGYDFKGWYTERTGGTLLSGETASDPTVTALYAQWTAKEILVTFDFNDDGTTGPEDKTVAFDAKYSTAAPGGFPVPTRTGYEFDGWWTDLEEIGSAQVTADTIMSQEAPQTLYAYWKPVTYKVTFILDGGVLTPNTPKDVTVGKTYGALPTPTRDGYYFDGWALDSNVIVTASTTVTELEAHDLTAQWVPDIKVTLNPNGGSAIASPDDKFVAELGELYPAGIGFVPTYSGYKFEGWYTLAAGGTLVDNTVTVTNPENHVLYAQWTPKTDIKVTLNPNGGAAIVSPDVDNFIVVFNQKYPTITVVPVYTGYKFEGWYTLATGGKLVDNTLTVTNGDDHTLYARWTLKNDIEVTLDADGGTVKTDKFNVTFTAAYGSKLDQIPTKAGYDFDGWYDAAAAGSQVNNATIVEKTANHTLYAYWTPAEYTLTLNGNGGTPATTTKPITYNVAYGDLGTAPERTGYDFLGWSSLKDDAALTGAVTVATVAGVDSQVIYAQWKAKDNITVNLNPQGGSVGTATFTATYDAPYGSNLTQVPVLSANKFLGWYDAATGGVKVENISKVTTEIEHTLYARWESLEFGLYFDPGVAGGTDWSGMYIEDGKPYSYNPDNPDPLNTENVFPVPTRIGYTFTGWYNHPTTGDTAVLITDIVPDGTTAAESMLYARWTPDSFNVKFDVAGGTSAADQPVTFDAAYGTLPATTRDGYGFDAWFTSSGKEITAATIFDTKIMPIPAEHTLTAKWTAQTYTITLNAAGGTLAGTGTISATYDRTYSALPTPTRSGYTFDGWFIMPADVKITPTDTVKVTADTPLTAKWTLIPPPNTYRLTVVNGTGSDNYLANAVVPIAAYGAPAGQVFAGWKVTAGNATIADTANPNTTLTMANGSVTVEATYRNSGPGKKMIFTTKYESKFWNWIMFIFLFGWIWMWFVK